MVGDTPAAPTPVKPTAVAPKTEQKQQQQQQQQKKDQKKTQQGARVGGKATLKREDTRSPALPDRPRQFTAGNAASGDRPQGSTRVPRREGGGGRGRGGYGNRAPRREHDRHSATGKVDSEKKLHQGWTSDPAHLVEEGLEAEHEAKQDLEALQQQQEEEEAAKTKTLEEYMAERKAKQAHTAAMIARKANEGINVDKSQQVEDVKVYVRKEEAFYVVEKEDQHAKKNKSGRKQKTVVLDIEQRFTEQVSLSGRGRGRGAGRGRGGRGGAQTGRGQSGAVNVDDTSAFPELR